MNLNCIFFKRGKSLTKFPFTLFTSYPYQSKVPYISIQYKYCIDVKRGAVKDNLKIYAQAKWLIFPLTNIERKYRISI